MLSYVLVDCFCAQRKPLRSKLVFMLKWFAYTQGLALSVLTLTQPMDLRLCSVTPPKLFRLKKTPWSSKGVQKSGI